jgi:hypothetical protein
MKFLWLDGKVDDGERRDISRNLERGFLGEQRICQPSEKEKVKAEILLDGQEIA